MPWCQIIGSYARTPFVITPYRGKSAGELKPILPSRGPCGGLLGEPCCLTVHHERERSTGPCFPVTVIYCSAHDVSFTLYPPGHVPYGREPLTPTAEGGQWITAEPVDGEDADDESLSAAVNAYRGTYFDAALDAALGLIGRREDSAGSSDLWWSTQQRRLQRGVSLLGLTSDVEVDEQHALAEILAVDTLLLTDQARQIEQKPGYRQRGKAICAVLASLRPGTWLPDRLAECGHRRGLWGAPWRWDQSSGALRRRPYRLVDTRGSPS